MGSIQKEGKMIAVDKEALPKRITPDDIHRLTGEIAYWFCPTCRKWRTTPIKPDRIVCSVCGDAPDWKKRPPTLAYRSRYQRVLDLCAEDSEWRKSYNEVEQQFGAYIDDVYSGFLSPRAKESGWLRFQSEWREVDKLADFLLTAQDAPTMDVPHTYTERGLQRRYYDPCRQHNVVSLSDLNLQPQYDDGDTKYSDAEIVELISLQASHTSGRPHKGVATERCEQLCDKHFQYEFLEIIGDPLERSIARDFSDGAKKRDIERKYGLSERQVRTKVAHIAKALKNF